MNRAYTFVLFLGHFGVVEGGGGGRGRRVSFWVGSVFLRLPEIGDGLGLELVVRWFRVEEGVARMFHFFFGRGESRWEELPYHRPPPNDDPRGGVSPKLRPSSRTACKDVLLS